MLFRAGHAEGRSHSVFPTQLEFLKGNLLSLLENESLCKVKTKACPR